MDITSFGSCPRVSPVHQTLEAIPLDVRRRSLETKPGQVGDVGRRVGATLTAEYELPHSSHNVACPMWHGARLLCQLPAVLTRRPTICASISVGGRVVHYKMRSAISRAHQGNRWDKPGISDPLRSPGQRELRQILRNHPTKVNSKAPNQQLGLLDPRLGVRILRVHPRASLRECVCMGVAAGKKRVPTIQAIERLVRGHLDHANSVIPDVLGFGMHFGP